MQARPYAGYETWKGWDRYFQFTADEAEYYAGELQGIPLAGRMVLEIGFGQGSFLAWARSQGAEVSGTEITEVSLAEAARNHVELLSSAIESIATEHRERFDAIVAFDVFEHFDLDEVAVRIRAVATMLKPGGFAVLRFPNGQSPFGLGPQNGDVTHKTALSKDKLEQLCQGTGLKTLRYGGSYVTKGRWGVTRIARAMRSTAQGSIGAVLNAVFGTAIPWDAVVVLVMCKDTGLSHVRRS